ncbi:MAG: glycosyltransferase, partial [Paucimonas sp.]|nr:glycosyltransferase [Paucimonas sp.]
MDLVITVSNTTAHLAGAQGVPVWTMVPDGPGCFWYWFRNRTDSPWYPSMRIFRQPEPGAWQPVIENVVQAIVEMPPQGQL